MKTKTLLFITILTLTVTGLFTDQAGASSKNKPMSNGILGKAVTEKIEMTISGKSGMEIRLEHSFGNIDIRPGQDSRIYISGEKQLTVKDRRITEEFLQEMKLEVIERPDKVIIKTHYPDDRLKKKVKNFSISYTIEIPSNVQLSVKNSFGQIDVRDVSGEFSIINKFGGMTAFNLKGETTLNNEFGSIDADEIDGNANISTGHSSLNIDHINGDLVAEGKFGSITVKNISGKAKISGGHGKIDCSTVTGDTDITNSFGPVTCGDIGGELTVRNSHNKVYVEDIRNNTSITTGFGKVTATNIDGDLDVTNQHSSVEAEIIHGNVDVHTSFGSVNVDQVDGDVIVNNQHSSITVNNVLQKEMNRKRSIRLKTSFGAIKLYVPDNLSAQITAHTSQGKFKSGFPLMVNLQNIDVSSSSTQNISGTVGDGRDSIELEGSNGNIYLEKM